MPTDPFSIQIDDAQVRATFKTLGEKVKRPKAAMQDISRSKSE
jgi:hypothetical protein